MADNLTNSIVWDKEQVIPLKKHKEHNLIGPSIVRIADRNTTALVPKILVKEDLLLHSIVPHTKIICQCVDFVAQDGQLYFSEQRFSIPMAYPGWFEILSADGKAVLPCKTIGELAKNSPERFLVRSEAKAFLSDQDGEPKYDQTREVQKGEVMTVLGEMSVTAGWRKQKKMILHCLDGGGLDVYFDFKVTGQFSPMAGPTNISGVHTIEGLTSRFRLPLTARVVSGKIPQIASKNDRPGLFRLVEMQKDVTALFLPLHSNQKLIPVSVRTNMSLIQAANMNVLSKDDYYGQLHAMCTIKCEKYFKTMQILVSATPKSTTYSASTLPIRGRATSSPDQIMHNGTKPTEEDILYNEVDDLYAYVRRGGVPPRPRPRSWATTLAATESQTTRPTDLNNGKSSSQPILSDNNIPRGMLASLTAGKFPARTSTLVRQHRIATSPTETYNLKSPLDLPAGKKNILRAFIDRYKGSVESINLVPVDTYVDEQHYQNFATIEQAKKSGIMISHLHQSTSDLSKKPEPKLPTEYSRSQSMPNDEDIYFTLEGTESAKPRSSSEKLKSRPSSQQYIITTTQNISNRNIMNMVRSSATFTKQSHNFNEAIGAEHTWKLQTSAANYQQHLAQIS